MLFQGAGYRQAGLKSEGSAHQHVSVCDFNNNVTLEVVEKQSRETKWLREE